MLFYDFEVFKEDWMVVIMDTDTRKTHVITNDSKELERIYNDNINNIWCGFNSRHYDQYILKGILAGFNPKRLNDFIIVKREPGWKFSSLLKQFPLNNYDVMNSLDRGLKSFEGFMGNSIKETSVPFDIDRKLTDEELKEVEKYCRHDVSQTMQVFIERKSDFEAHLGLVKVACEGKPLDLSLIGRTKAQLSAIILDATRRDHDDEFDIDFPQSMRINKYRDVVRWYQNPDNRCYKYPDGSAVQLNIDIAGVPHQFGWGGVHGAIPQYYGKGFFINMDVASLYPSLMIQYNLLSRNMSNPKKYVDIYHTRLKYKKEKNPLQAPLKLVLNSTYGVMKDKNNPLFDPLQANRVCVYGQLLLLDLIEHLEPIAKIIQSNTDGVLVKMPPGNDPDEWYAKVDDIAYEWEQRTGLTLEFDEYAEIFQKDVNNYVVIDAERHFKSKGAYVKKLSHLDYDLPIVNKALIDFMVKGIPVDVTINSCNQLKEFQLVSKITYKYKHILYGNEPINEKCIRIFASKDDSDPGVRKVHAETNTPAKIPNSPEHCFLYNDEVNGLGCPEKLDKNWYIDLAVKRLSDFGVMANELYR